VNPPPFTLAHEEAQSGALARKTRGKQRGQEHRATARDLVRGVPRLIHAGVGKDRTVKANLVQSYN
jgi:hypothetical protein